jgi:hypothetical protein
MNATALAWLNAQLDEDEQTARAAASSLEREPRISECRGAAEWSHRYDEDDYGGTEVVDGDGHVVVPLATDSGGAVRVHVARHDPKRVLAEVEAKRRILARHTGDHTCPAPPEPWHWYEGGERVEGVYPCGDVRDLALPYADRAGFPEELRHR